MSNERQTEHHRQETTSERTDTGSILDTVPGDLPALMLAQALQEQCAAVGFDWSDEKPVLDKVNEEVTEIEQELLRACRNPLAVEEEIGDALFAMVNLARHCNVDADTALRKASDKFSARFRSVEMLAEKAHRPLATLSLEEMEALWVQVKRQR